MLASRSFQGEAVMAPEAFGTVFVGLLALGFISFSFSLCTICSELRRLNKTLEDLPGKLSAHLPLIVYAHTADDAQAAHLHAETKLNWPAERLRKVR
jgi:hypothetical protein